MRVTTSILAFLCAIGLVSSAFALTDSSASTMVLAEKVKADAEKSVKNIMKTQMLENAKANLESKEWIVFVSPTLSQSGRKVKGGDSESLTFKDGKVAAKNLIARGYPESNFTLNVQNDGTAVWETMQVNEKEGIIFLRGELKDTGMKGVISNQPMKGEKSTANFSTNQADVTGTPEQPAAAAPVVKKKGKK
ncbi:MAG TPA: hypothetical protein PKL77_03990 [Candidatus Omnitrophota bacterium]|nr:hypothetical protein [Candidatus Omnitrophota bacterium]HPT07798.1 hypothetical protein [Candidatus Omnitrophota bacterium]